MGFDPFVAYQSIAAAGIRYVEVPAAPARQSVAWRQTHFVPELLGPSEIDALKAFFAELGLSPLVVSAMCDLADPAQLDPLFRRIDFARSLGAAYVIVDAPGGPHPDPDHLQPVL